jgi:hypothetical protein
VELLDESNGDLLIGWRAVTILSDECKAVNFPGGLRLMKR